MNRLSESTDRHAMDYVHVAVGCLGALVIFAGIVTLSIAIAIAGVVCVVFALSYFLMET